MIRQRIRTRARLRTTPPSYWGRQRRLSVSLTILVPAYRRTNQLVIRALPMRALPGPIRGPCPSTTQVLPFWPAITLVDESTCAPSGSALLGLLWEGPLTRGSPGPVPRSYRFRAQQIGDGPR